MKKHDQILLGKELAGTGKFGEWDQFVPAPFHSPKSQREAWAGRVFGRQMVRQHILRGKPWKFPKKPIRLRRREAFANRRA